MSALDHCKDCSSPPLPNERRCQSCKEAHNERERARRQARRDAGLCVVCGDFAVVDDQGKPMSMCDEHRRAYEVKREREKQRAHGKAVPTRPGLFARVSSAQQETKQKPRRRADASKVTRRSKVRRSKARKA